jgi:hypothetical protein
MSYSENQLIKLAQTNPKELARVLTSPNKDVHMLTFGVEIMCEEIKDEAITIPVIRQLLKHINAVVREGAVIGASCFFTGKKPPQDILDRLIVMSNSDPSPSIKESAKDVLESFENI